MSILSKANMNNILESKVNADALINCLVWWKAQSVFPWINFLAMVVTTVFSVTEFCKPVPLLSETRTSSLPDAIQLQITFESKDYVKSSYSYMNSNLYATNLCSVKNKNAFKCLWSCQRLNKLTKTGISIHVYENTQVFFILVCLHNVREERKIN